LGFFCNIKDNYHNPGCIGILSPGNMSDCMKGETQMYLSKHTIDTTDPKYEHYRDESVLKDGSYKAVPDFLYQKDTRGNTLDLSGYQFQFAQFSDERRVKIPTVTPKGYIVNRFQFETFIVSEGNRHVLTLFVKSSQLRLIIESGQAYPGITIPSVLVGKSVEWKHPRDGGLSRAVVVHRLEV